MIKVSINPNAPATYTSSIFINAPAARVWEVLSDIDQWAEWQTDVKSAKLNGELKPDTTFTWKAGGVKIVSTLHTVEPNVSIGWTGSAIGMFAIHNWHLSEHSGQTEVLVEESMEGVLVSLFKSKFNKTLRKGIQASLEQLKKEAEKREGTVMHISL